MASVSPRSRIAAIPPSVNSGTSAGRSSFATSASGPAGTCTTRNPGSTTTSRGRSLVQARVYTSHSTPAWASADTSSRTYTFMPPLSPTPGWTSGDVWKERTASRRTTGQTLPKPRRFPLGRVRPRARLRRGLVGLLLGDEGLVDPHEGLLLLLGEL